MKTLIDNNDLIGVTEFLTKGYNINAQDHNGHTALMYAVLADSFEVFEYLLSVSDLDLSIENAERETVLTIASNMGRYSMIKLLYAIPNIDLEGYTPLMFAVIGNDEDLVDEIIKENVDINAISNKSRETALFIAVKMGHAAIVKKLLQLSDIDVNSKNSYGHSALIFAVNKGYDDIFEMLVSKEGIDLKSETTFGYNALKYTIDKGRADMFHRLIDLDVGLVQPNMLTYALASRRFDMFNVLLKINGIDVNARFWGGDKNVLMHAAEHGYHEVVNSLLALSQIDINAKSYTDLTAFMYAACSGDLKTLKAFLDLPDIDINLQDSSGDMAVSHALRHNNSEAAIELLRNHAVNINLVNRDRKNVVMQVLESGVIPEPEQLNLVNNITDYAVTDNEGKNYLMYASRSGSVALVRYFADFIDINAIDNRGKTALMYAIENGSLEIASYLLSKEDIEVNAYNKNGDNALILSVKLVRPEVLALLLSDRRVYINFVANNGYTALMFAADSGELGLVKQLLKMPLVDVDVKCKENLDTALILAARKGHAEIVQHLLKMYYTDINFINNQGYSALTSAIFFSRYEVADILLSEKNIKNNTKLFGNEEPLQHFIRKGNPYIARRFLSFSGIDKQYYEPVVIATIFDDVSFVEDFFKSSSTGIDHMCDGKTLLMYAASLGCSGVFNLLLAMPCIKVNDKDKYGKTALMYASENGFTDIVAKLVARKDLNINAKSSFGKTALIYAVQRGHSSVVRQLLKSRRIDINAGDGLYNLTALIIAARYSYVAIVRDLLEFPGIDISIATTGDMNTALMYAVENGHTEIVSLLIKKTRLEDRMFANIFGENIYILAKEDSLKYLIYSGQMFLSDSINLLDDVSAVARIKTLRVGYRNTIERVKDNLYNLSKLISGNSEEVINSRLVVLISRICGIAFPERAIYKNTGMSILKFRATAGLMRAAKLGKIISGSNCYIFMQTMMFRENKSPKGKFPFFQNMIFDIKAYLLEFLVGKDVVHIISDLRHFEKESASLRAKAQAYEIAAESTDVTGSVLDPSP